MLRINRSTYLLDDLVMDDLMLAPATCTRPPECIGRHIFGYTVYEKCTFGAMDAMYSVEIFVYKSVPTCTCGAIDVINALLNKTQLHQATIRPPQYNASNRNTMAGHVFMIT